MVPTNSPADGRTQGPLRRSLVASKQESVRQPRHTARTAWAPTPGATMTTTTRANGRIQLALNVSDLAAAVRVYSDMFGTEPSKARAGYANFAIADPPLKLVLFENPDASSPLNHLGV